MNRACLPLFAAIYLACPGVAHACSTCMDPREGNRTLLSVTIVLSLLPLLLMVAIGAYLWSRVVRAERLAAVTNLPLPAGPASVSERE